MTDKLKALIEAARARKLAQQSGQPTLEITPTVNVPDHISAPKQSFGFVWNEQQAAAIELAKSGKDFCLIGAAGTGKTSVVREIVRQMMDSGMVGTFQEETKFFKKGMPAIAFVSFTNRAVRRLASQLSADIRKNAHTIHSAIEFEPVIVEGFDEQGNPTSKRVFEPMRHAENPIVDLQWIIVDESSMVGTRLFDMLKAASPNARFIFIGDLNQIPPVYDDAILGFKLLDLPVVELTQVYRQALESPIIALAHEILKGRPISMKRQKELSDMGKGLTFMHYKKPNLSDAVCLNGLKNFFTKEVKSGNFNEDEAVILCPFNKAERVGTIELNKIIGQAYTDIGHKEVHEVIAGFEKHYFCIGDRVLHEGRREAIIHDIKPNPNYVGKPPRDASFAMDRWGNFSSDHVSLEMLNGQMQDLENSTKFIMGQAALLEESDDDERKRAASHVIVLKILNDEGEPSDFDTPVSSAGDVNKLIFAWAISVHKSQGSEWKKVYLVFHHSHSRMLSRELTYTAVTRAREELLIICEPESRVLACDSTFDKAPRNHAIKGSTLKEKAEFFKGKRERMETKPTIRTFGQSKSSVDSILQERL